MDRGCRRTTGERNTQNISHTHSVVAGTWRFVRQRGAAAVGIDERGSRGDPGLGRSGVEAVEGEFGGFEIVHEF